MQRLEQLPGWVWPAAALIVAGAVLTWHRYVTTHPEESYLDADQPPLQIDVPPMLVPRSRRVTYPPTIRDFVHSMAGDC